MKFANASHKTDLDAPCAARIFHLACFCETLRAQKL